MVTFSSYKLSFIIITLAASVHVSPSENKEGFVFKWYIYFCLMGGYSLVLACFCLALFSADTPGFWSRPEYVTHLRRHISSMGSGIEELHTPTFKSWFSIPGGLVFSYVKRRWCWLCGLMWDVEGKALAWHSGWFLPVPASFSIPLLPRKGSFVQEYETLSCIALVLLSVFMVQLF